MLGMIIGLMVLGFMLVGMEIFIIPGFGITGILGVLSLGAGTVLAWRDFGPAWGVLLMCASVALSVVGVWVLLKTKAGKRLVLQDAVSAKVHRDEDLQSLVGRRGRVVTMLRPSGTVEIDGERLQVVAEHGELIDVGTLVEVIHHDVSDVVVTSVAEV